MEEEYNIPDSSHSIVHGAVDNRMAGKMSCEYAPRGSLLVYSSAADRDYLNDDDEDELPVVTSVVECSWTGLIWNRHIRKLINQSHGFFMKLQRVASSEKGIDPKHIVEFSQLYRSALRECVIGLNTDLECTDAEDEHTQLKDLVELYSMLETAWHLCEILFIETLPVGCLVQQLLEWIRWHNKDTNTAYHNVMEAMTPHEEPDYWHVVYSLALQGRTDDLREILRHLPECERNPKVYNSISELLRKMPMVRSVVGRSWTELRGSWYEWRQECKRRYDRGEFRVSNNLHILAGLLCGDEESFKDDEVKNSCVYWYEMMVGRLLYCSPLIINTDYDLQLTAEICMRQYIDVKQMGTFDKILLTALQNNIIDVLKISSSVLSDWWFVSHLSNILHHRGVLVSHHFEYGSRLTEFVLIEYSTSLFSHSSLWQIAIDYLSHCPTQGRHLMTLLIERVPLEYDYKALKVLNVCNKYGLKDQAQSVCRVMARKAYTKGQLGNALTWSIRSKDASFAAFIAEKYFDSYEFHGKFMDLGFLDNLGDAMLLSKRLTFLGKYREIQIRYSKGDFIGAGDLLIGLLESGTVPRKYWMTLLTDTLPLLELEDQIVFSSDKTYALMRLLQQVDEYQFFDKASNMVDTNKQTMEFDVNKEKIALLQLSLVRNLQKAILHHK